MIHIYTHEELPPDLNCVSDVHSQSSSTKLMEKPFLGPSLVDVVKKPATHVQENLPDSDEGFQTVTRNQKKKKFFIIEQINLTWLSVVFICHGMIDQFTSLMNIF